MYLSTPPMGWNSWNTFGYDINETVVLETAEAMVKSGLRDAGYTYLVIDDCWSEKQRDANGRLVPNREKFPHGMKFVADRVHESGLKFGMYACDGVYTCTGHPGSFQKEFIDAETFAAWGVDYLKYDNCFKPVSSDLRLLCHRMGLALENCGRDVVYSACNWGPDNEVHTWIKETGAHLWRSTGDIRDNWESVKSILNAQKDYQPYNGQGCFNDMDMLTVGMCGNGFVSFGGAGCTDIEYRTHFSAWAMLNSPLMMGCDVRRLSDTMLKILTDRDILAINQDPACRQPKLINSKAWPTDESECQVWVKHLANGDLAIGMFNMGDGVANPNLYFYEMSLDRSTGRALELYDLWEKKSLGVYEDVFQPSIQPHDCLMLRAKLVPAK